MGACVQCGFACEAEYGFCPQCGFPVGRIGEKRVDPLLGRTLAGSYTILEVVGLGGMGRVYRAEQRTLGRTVAVKVIQPQYSQDNMMAQRFINEARAVSKLNHPNVVGVIDFGRTEDEHLYLVMEFLRGRDLRKVVEAEGPLPLERVISLLTQVLSALSEAHELGIVHRDLKPENIIVEPRRNGGDFVKVVDFGIAKMVEGTTQMQLTSPGSVCGTPGYMAPEQAGGHGTDARSDLYAVGVIFYELLAGRMPFIANAPSEVMLQQLSQRAPDPREVAPERDIPAEVAELVMRAIEREPEKRFAEADEFSAALLACTGRAQSHSSSPFVSLRPSAPSTGQFCGTCSSAMEAGQKFCGECGARRSGEFLVTAPSLQRLSQGVTRQSQQLPSLDHASDLRWLTAQLAQAREGLKIIRLTGEVGVGKSTLLRSFLMEAQQAGAQTVLLTPDAWGVLDGVTLYGVRTLLKKLSLSPSMPPAETPSPEGTYPMAPSYVKRALASLGEQGDSASSPAARRRDLADTLRWSMLKPGAHSRLVVGIDDLHRLDSASANVLADLLHDPPAVGLLLVCTHPLGFKPAWEQVFSETRELEGIDDREARAWLQGAGRGFASAELNQLPASRLGYAPLYLFELSRQSSDDRSASLGLADLVAGRMSRLGADARHVLQMLAVVGNELSRARLERLLEQVDVRVGLSELVEASFVQIEGELVRWRHGLYREIASSIIPASARQELYRHVYEVSDELSAPLEARAHFATQAGFDFEALFLLEQVAARSKMLDDAGAAVHVLEQGLQVARRQAMLAEADDPAQTMVIFGRKLGEVLLDVGRLTEAEGVLREAFDIASGDGPEVVRLVQTLCRVLTQKGAPDPALEQLLAGLVDPQTRIRRNMAAMLETLRRGTTS